ncbi:hypothetical protein B0H66DRAFT_614364 [Apodospora peruviana]|uniref:Uncharacterized protein n=1 Tax=Apodospora peruviana TaxID=516989 RepID=A0AAE0HSP8_9PEZI|nr:hypothetical protein B0H66DRAFT_614364 [Apodospora peruviana]
METKGDKIVPGAKSENGGTFAWQLEQVGILPISGVQFGYTPDFYGFYGSSSANSSSLQAGARVTLQYSQPIKPGYITNNGTKLFVSDSGLTSIGGGALNGTFQIIMDSALPTPNRSVVGLARQEEDGTPAPVAAVELKPAVEYAFHSESCRLRYWWQLGPGTCHRLRREGQLRQT